MSTSDNSSSDTEMTLMNSANEAGSGGVRDRVRLWEAF